MKDVFVETLSTRPQTIFMTAHRLFKSETALMSPRQKLIRAVTCTFLGPVPSALCSSELSPYELLSSSIFGGS